MYLFYLARESFSTRLVFDFCLFPQTYIRFKAFHAPVLVRYNTRTCISHWKCCTELKSCDDDFYHTRNRICWCGNFFLLLLVVGRLHRLFFILILIFSIFFSLCISSSRADLFILFYFIFMMIPLLYNWKQTRWYLKKNIYIRYFLHQICYYGRGGRNNL